MLTHTCPGQRIVPCGHPHVLFALHVRPPSPQCWLVKHPTQVLDSGSQCGAVTAHIELSTHATQVRLGLRIGCICDKQSVFAAHWTQMASIGSQARAMPEQSADVMQAVAHVLVAGLQPRPGPQLADERQATHLPACVLQ
jgi:hypothetical protein